MKFVKNFSKILVLILLLNISIFYHAKLSKNIKSFSKQDEMKKIWTDIFSKPQGENCINLTPKQLEAEKLLAAETESGVSWSGPRKKTNINDKQQGYGTSAYLFDYIDDLFQADITKEFQRIFDEVKKLIPDIKDYSDPYPLSKLVSSFSPNQDNIPAETATTTDSSKDQELLDKIKSITKQNNKVFNENSYKNSVTAANIFKACKDFQWNYNTNENNWAKKIVDRYDFDGDGRLNPREFVMMTIIHNENILGTTCKNCYNEIISKKIDPIFKFLDCNNDNKISAEDIWENFGSLKRKSPGKSNIYSCVIRNEKYRTNAVNDFFIKNMKSFDGFLNKEEFRRAILLGYWDRHTDVEKIYLDETKTFKQLRWGANGDTDVVCDRINNVNNPAPPAKKQGSHNSKESRAKDYFFRRN